MVAIRRIHPVAEVARRPVAAAPIVVDAIVIVNVVLAEPVARNEALLLAWSTVCMLVAADSLNECGFSLKCLFLGRCELLFGLFCLFIQHLYVVLALAIDYGVVHCVLGLHELLLQHSLGIYVM
jgi:hypothetical protein